MHNNNFVVTSDQFNLGSHFLVWSVYYLSGSKQYYQGDSLVDLPGNPMDKGAMAHEMKLNCPTTIKECKDDIDMMSTIKKSYHMRFIPESRTLKDYVEINEEFKRIATGKKVKVINIGCQGLQHLVAFLRSHILPNWSTLNHPTWQHDIEIVKEHCTHYWPNFFSNKDMFADKLEGWNGIREQIAFNIRPYDYFEHLGTNEKNEHILECSFDESVINPLETYKKIFKFLDYRIDKDRLQTWMPIHQRWAKKIVPTIYFCNDLNSIIDNIINGKDINLSKYGMDVLKEAIILHLLMYKHDLNFKIDVDKLPDSTLEISKLLQKNDRTGIANLYGKQS